MWIYNPAPPDRVPLQPRAAPEGGPQHPALAARGGDQQLALLPRHPQLQAALPAPASASGEYPQPRKIVVR